MKRSIGFYCWGALTDKVSENLRKNDPAGYAFQFTLALYAFLQNDWDVYWFYPRCKEDFDIYGKQAFAAFETERRWKIYNSLKFINPLTDDLPQLDVLISMYRWDRGEQYKQIYGDDDLKVQTILFERYKNIPKIVWDDDFKLPLDFKLDNTIIAYTSLKSRNYSLPAFYLPYPFNYPLVFSAQLKNSLKHIVYVGNRYERDEQFERWYVNYSQYNKYKVHVYGNWFRTYDDLYLNKKWWFICYHDRIGFQDFYKTYSDGISCVIISKNEYSQYNKITPRFFEVVYFGSLPIIPPENESAYGNLVVDNLKIQSIDELKDCIKELQSMPLTQYNLLRYKIWDNIQVAGFTVNNYYNTILKALKEEFNVDYFRR